MILNARLQTEQSPADSLPILLIHGLFGSLDNLGVLARGLKDVRNHGLSPRSDEMNYAVMAQDMVETLDAHGIDRVAVIGHSMGGKIA
ncbi:alpha/beta fold hydrolase, partial [Pantoea agglomerans]|nr:alpha/beta fold hydrolase [Pantoea agglomerans]